MSDTPDESGDAPDSRDAIMDATYRALCEHGHADLTMQHIADEAGKSTALLHYHFDTKEELLAAFIDHLITEFESTVAPDENESATERLREFLDLWVLEPEEDDRTALHLALLELRSRGPFNETYREELARSDEVLRRIVVEIIRDGIEQGVFRDVEPEGTARLIVATLDGARTRQITLDDPAYSRRVREQLEDQFVERLLVGDDTDRR